jgi:integrase
MKIAAMRIFEQAYLDGPPKSRMRIARDTPLSDAWSTFRKTQLVSRDHDKSRNAVMQKHILPEYGNKPVSSLNKLRTRELLERLSLLEGGQARTLLKHLKRFFTWCVDVSLIDFNPLHRFKLLMPINRKAKLTTDELARIIKATGQIPGPWQSIVALSVATAECVGDIRHMRVEDIDLRLQEWWKSHVNDTSPYGIPDDHGVFLNDFALNVLEGLSQSKGFVFQSPRTRHNGQATLVELELAIQWRSNITERIREFSDVPGDWTMKEVRRSAFILSGLQRVEQLYAEQSLEARKAARERALKEWSRKLFKAMEDQQSAHDLLLPEDGVVL